MCACMTLIGTMYASGAVTRDGGRWTVIILIYVRPSYILCPAALIPFFKVFVAALVTPFRTAYANHRISSFSMTWAVAGKVGGQGLVLNAPI